METKLTVNVLYTNKDLSCPEVTFETDDGRMIGFSEPTHTYWYREDKSISGDNWYIKYKDGKLTFFFTCEVLGGITSETKFSKEETKIILAELDQIATCADKNYEYRTATKNIKFHIENISY